MIIEGSGSLFNVDISMTFFRVFPEFCTALILEKYYFDISMCVCSPNNRKSTILFVRSLVFFFLGDRIILTNRKFYDFFKHLRMEQPNEIESHP